MIGLYQFTTIPTVTEQHIWACMAGAPLTIEPIESFNRTLYQINSYVTYIERELAIISKFPDTRKFVLSDFFINADDRPNDFCYHLL